MKRLALISVLGAMTAVASAQLYSQGPHAPGATGGNGMSSFFGNLGDPNVVYDRQVADDFTVTGPGWSVNRVVSNWIEFTPNSGNPVTSVNIKFFSKVGGGVGALVADRSLSAVTLGNGPGTYFGRPERTFDSSFANVFLAPGDYFVMVQPNVNHNWFWLNNAATIAGSSAHFQRGPGAQGGTDATWPGTWTASAAGQVFAAQDVSFQIHGTVVPEPATLAALGLGAVALIRRRRSK